MRNISNEAVEILTKAAEILETSKDKFYELCSGMQQADLELTDIYHDLEFNEHEDEKLLELAKEVKRLRKHRRVIKEDQEIYTFIKDFHGKNATFTARLKDLANGASMSVERRKKRVYVPRVRTEQMEIIYAEEAEQTIAVLSEFEAEEVNIAPLEGSEPLDVQAWDRKEDKYETVYTITCAQQPWLHRRRLTQIRGICETGISIQFAGYRPYGSWDAYVDVCIQRLMLKEQGQTDYWVRSVLSKRPNQEERRGQQTSSFSLTREEQRRLKKLIKDCEQLV